LPILDIKAKLPGQYQSAVHPIPRKFAHSRTESEPDMNPSMAESNLFAFLMNVFAMERHFISKFLSLFVF
jgi:hypothetical protein